MPTKCKIDKSLIEQEYFQNNKSQKEIANKLGISQWVISQRMKEFGLKSKNRTWKLHNHVYSVNEEFFDELNGENALALGWLASDGYVQTKANSFVFGFKIAKKDEEVLYKIKELLKFNGRINSFENVLSKTGKSYAQVQMYINSKKLVKRLKKFGIVQNKTANLKFPSLIAKSNQESIIKNFILGAFEGDGSILFDQKYNSPCFQIIGTKEMLEGIQIQLMKFIGLSKKKLTKNTLFSNHYALRYRGKYQAMRIFDWLYLNKKQFLTRKYKKYLEIKRGLYLSAE